MKQPKDRKDAETCFEKLANLPESESPRCENQSCQFALKRACRGCAMADFILSKKENFTLQEIGNLYGLSRMRVCQIERKIISSLTDSHV
jgi:DNA-directed RNA polymerase sigma subunit (sigma70/sigma32)